MQIPFAARSIFTGVIVEALSKAQVRAALEEGHKVTVALANHRPGTPERSPCT